MGNYFKQIVQKDKKHFTEAQIYITTFELLKNKILININKNMSRDYKIEFGYIFIGYIRNFIKNFCKLYKNKENNFYDKGELFKEINDDIENINISLEMLLTLKEDDKDNWVGLSKNQILDIKRDWGKIISQYENYSKWIINNAN